MQNQFKKLTPFLSSNKHLEIKFKSYHGEYKRVRSQGINPKINVYKTFLIEIKEDMYNKNMPYILC